MDNEKKYDLAAIGERISEERSKIGKSMEEIAVMVGTTRQSISKWEKGQGSPGIYDFLKLCGIFNCELGYLLCEEGYTCKTRKATDIKDATGLSEDAIEKLQKLNRLNSLYSRTIQNFLSIMLTDGVFLPEMYRSFVEVWNMRQKSGGKSPVVDNEGGIYLFGNDAVDAIMFHIQKEIIKLLEEFFLSYK